MQPQEMSVAQFAQQAIAYQLFNHGRKWEVRMGPSFSAFSDADTADAAIADVHRAAVNNAIYLNLPGAPKFGFDKPMPPVEVLTAYLPLVIELAATCDDVDDGFAVVQKAIGVTDGGPAGIFYMDREEEWDDLSEQARAVLLTDYVEWELTHYGPGAADAARGEPAEYQYRVVVIDAGHPLLSTNDPESAHAGKWNLLSFGHLATIIDAAGVLVPEVEPQLIQQEALCQFIAELRDKEQIFHLDDSPSQSVVTATGEPTFTPAEADRLANQVADFLEALGHDQLWATAWPFMSESDPVVIYSPNEAACGNGGGFWSNEDGWTDLENATEFEKADVIKLTLPLSSGGDAQWFFKSKFEV